MSDEAIESTRGPHARQIAVGATVWHVFEHVPEYDRRSSPTLVFASDGAMRRVRDFPARWWELSDDELLAISWGC